MKRKFILTSLALTFCMGMYAEQPVTVETDSMRRIDLEEVMIHATKTGALLKDLPNRVEVVTKRQIEASGINNLTDLLKNFVNVDVIEYPGYNSYFSIRGFKPTEGKYTTVLIDGVPAGTTNMATLSLGDVEQVEVLKGPFSAMYGSDAMGENPVEWRRNELHGVVESSLWLAMSKYNADPQLAVVLSNIFGWTIDFFGLQKQDEFRVIYEQEYVDGKSLLNFNVLGAAFRHGDSTYYAIPFELNGEKLYYDRAGKSLEGAFLKAPLDFFRISSRFSNSRFHPVLKRYRAHHGVDYAAPTGTPVYAIGKGRVIAKGYQAKGGGNYVKIRHNSIYTTTYMHLSRFEKGIKVGVDVAQKQVIGYVGATGLATGPHLDFRVYENGKPINPLTIKSQPQKTLKDGDLNRYEVVRDSVIRMLTLIPDVRQENTEIPVDTTVFEDNESI